MDNSTKQLMSALAQSGAAGVKEVFRAQLSNSTSVSCRISTSVFS